MPLYRIIDSRAELVAAVAEGDVTLAHAMAFLRTLSGAEITGNRKLFDGRNGTSSMAAQEPMRLFNNPTRARNWLEAQARV